MEELKNQEAEQLQDVLNEGLQEKAAVLSIGGDTWKSPKTSTPRGNKRNMVRQEITLKDGTKKVIWHQKRFSASQYADFSRVWKEANTTAKITSKRQRLLRGEIVGDTIKD